eukprot:TRINITY_DN14305_c0_g1_i1.p2 TRINITY_DN14305_c0_g1~~TRINITY_DN14305_c0_g1_i1.p2  ORF type:complete len:137 (-),score=28.23 TRINITY_DN14305_c0_g1_i1:13-423(-)
MSWVNGDKYNGEWKSDRRHGVGVFVTSDGTLRYDGSWENDVRSGEGTCKDSMGVYKGSWSRDMMHGQGVCVTTDNVKYEGEWVDDQMNGKIKMTERGITIEQDWRDGMLMEGSGSINFAKHLYSNTPTLPKPTHFT